MGGLTLENGSRFKSIVAADSASLLHPSAASTIFERCLSGLDQIYSYEFQKALDSSPKRSLLAAAVAAAPKIRVLAVGLLVDAFVRLLRDILGDVPELSDDRG